MKNKKGNTLLLIIVAVILFLIIIVISWLIIEKKQDLRSQEAARLNDLVQQQELQNKIITKQGYESDQKNNLENLENKNISNGDFIKVKKCSKDASETYYFFDNGNWKRDLILNRSDSNINSYVLNDGSWYYNWSDTNKKGMKIESERIKNVYLRWDSNDQKEKLAQEAGVDAYGKFSQEEKIQQTKRTIVDEVVSSVIGRPETMNLDNWGYICNYVDLPVNDFIAPGDINFVTPPDITLDKACNTEWNDFCYQYN